MVDSKCKNCFGKFTPCSSCLSANYYGYRKDFCSPGCFQSFIEKESDKLKEYPMKNPIRGKIFDENKMVDIADFDYTSLNSHYFKDHYGVIREINDFFYMILYREVLIDLLKASYENGYEKGVADTKRIKRQPRKSKKSKV